jgi:hypothetical protein
MGEYEEEVQKDLAQEYGIDETPAVQALSNALRTKGYSLLSLDRLLPVVADKFVLTIQKTEKVPTARRSDILGQPPPALPGVSDCPA